MAKQKREQQQAFNAAPGGNSESTLLESSISGAGHHKKLLHCSLHRNSNKGQAVLQALSHITEKEIPFLRLECPVLK
eukprot:1147146-Pelagomonas_calceolata.AAC.15